MICSNGVGPLSTGAFTVEIRLQFAGGGGIFFLAGKEESLAWGLLNRKGGLAQISYNVKTQDGESRKGKLEFTEVFKNVGPLRFDRFYHYALTFDGKRTFRMYIDGALVSEAQLGEGERLSIDANSCRIGLAKKWHGIFRGQIAEARISSVERQFTPHKKYYPANLQEAGKRWFYGFDMGPDKGRVAEGYLAVGPGGVYTKQKG